MTTKIIPDVIAFHSKTMSSVELLGLINKERAKINRPTVRHNDFMKKALRIVIPVKIEKFYQASGSYQMSVAHFNSDNAEYLKSIFIDNGRGIYGKDEAFALSVIEQVVGVELVRQFKIGGYRIDGYDAKNNVAYEIDEQHHTYSKKEDFYRQEYIERELGCRFVRVKV